MAQKLIQMFVTEDTRKNVRLISQHTREKLFGVVERLVKKELEKVVRETSQKFDTISDGLGSTWSKICPHCQKPAMHVVRPGKVQCGECE
jgi:hypothetical protein